METLVLSAAWEPMQIVPWQRAITLLWSDKVEIVEEYRDKTICTVNVTFHMPSVVRFLRTLRPHKRAIKFSRQNVWARDKGRCQYCGNKVARHEATYDHVLPRSLGGLTRWENVVIACVGCNQKKANRTPEQAHMRMLSFPVKPKSLPGVPDLSVTYRPGMPTAWSQYLRDLAYWYGTLEQS